MYQYALKLEADAIVTRNQKDFEKSLIKVFDCDELFAYLAEEKASPTRRCLGSCSRVMR